jgi:hypothetical protein
MEQFSVPAGTRTPIIQPLVQRYVEGKRHGMLQVLFPIFLKGLKQLTEQPATGHRLHA